MTPVIEAPERELRVVSLAPAATAILLIWLVRG
jgi:uncharacterized protein YjeT (DUF2065 family)